MTEAQRAIRILQSLRSIDAAGEAGDLSFLQWLHVVLEDRRSDEPLEDAAMRTLDRMASAH